MRFIWTSNQTCQLNAESDLLETWSQHCANTSLNTLWKQHLWQAPLNNHSWFLHLSQSTVRAANIAALHQLFHLTSTQLSFTTLYPIPMANRGNIQRLFLLAKIIMGSWPSRLLAPTEPRLFVPAPWLQGYTEAKSNLIAVVTNAIMQITDHKEANDPFERRRAKQRSTLINGLAANNNTTSTRTPRMV